MSKEDNWDSDPDFIKLRKDFITSLTQRVLRLRELLQELSRANTQTQAIEELREIAHQLAGSCGSYGLSDLSKSFEEIEVILGPPGAPMGNEAIILPAVIRLSEQVLLYCELSKEHIAH